MSAQADSTASPWLGASRSKSASVYSGPVSTAASSRPASYSASVSASVSSRPPGTAIRITNECSATGYLRKGFRRIGPVPDGAGDAGARPAGEQVPQQPRLVRLLVLPDDQRLAQVLVAQRGQEPHRGQAAGAAGGLVPVADGGALLRVLLAVRPLDLGQAGREQLARAPARRAARPLDQGQRHVLRLRLPRLGVRQPVPGRRHRLLRVHARVPPSRLSPSRP